jgi:hypothetical protein
MRASSKIAEPSRNVGTVLCPDRDAADKIITLDSEKWSYWQGCILPSGILTVVPSWQTGPTVPG